VVKILGLKICFSIYLTTSYYELYHSTNSFNSSFDDDKKAFKGYSSVANKVKAGSLDPIINIRLHLKTMNSKNLLLLSFLSFTFAGIIRTITACSDINPLTSQAPIYNAPLYGEDFPLKIPGHYMVLLHPGSTMEEHEAFVNIPAKREILEGYPEDQFMVFGG
jgi:hypothetical protein